MTRSWSLRMVSWHVEGDPTEGALLVAALKKRSFSPFDARTISTCGYHSFRISRAIHGDVT